MTFETILFIDKPLQSQLLVQFMQQVIISVAVADVITVSQAIALNDHVARSYLNQDVQLLACTVPRSICDS